LGIVCRGEGEGDDAFGEYDALDWHPTSGENGAEETEEHDSSFLLVECCDQFADVPK
jgi:hypothetical protein